MPQEEAEQGAVVDQVLVLPVLVLPALALPVLARRALAPTQGARAAQLRGHENTDRAGCAGRLVLARVPSCPR